MALGCIKKKSIPGVIRWSNRVEELVEHHLFTQTVIYLIVLNTFVLASEHYDMPSWLQKLSDIMNLIFTFIFAAEMVLKLFGLGLNKYISDNFNIFDGVIVIISIIELVVGEESSGLSVLRAFRLLRVFKIIKSWTSLRILLATVLESLGAITNLGMLTILYIFIFALLAKQFYSEQLVDDSGEPSRYSFMSMTDSLITVFIVLTGENWNQIMIEVITQQETITSPTLFFCSLIIIGNYMLLNLFLAILLKFISENSEAESENPEDDEQVDDQKPL